MKPRTLRQWLELLPKPYRAQAAYNYARHPMNVAYKVYETMDRAINGAFVWSKTPEGSDYWMDIHDQYANGRRRVMEPEANLKSW